MIFWRISMTCMTFVVAGLALVRVCLQLGYGFEETAETLTNLALSVTLIEFFVVVFRVGDEFTMPEELLRWKILTALGWLGSAFAIGSLSIQQVLAEDDGFTFTASLPSLIWSMALIITGLVVRSTPQARRG